MHLFVILFVLRIFQFCTRKDNFPFKKNYYVTKNHIPYMYLEWLKYTLHTTGYFKEFLLDNIAKYN